MAKKDTTQKRITVGGNMSGGTRTVILSQTKRGSIDIATYMKALKSAENVDFPNRTSLYDIYDDILNDAHLSAVITKRKSAILNTPIEFKRDGKVDEQIGEQLRSPWFYNFLGDLLDTIYFGNSLFQFYRNGHWIGYDLVPRKHVDPIRRVILRRQSDITTGIPFDEFDNLVPVGKSRDLGILVKAAPLVIYKRNTLGDWAQFSELFGQPIREGTYDGWDEQARVRLMEDMLSMGGSSILLHPENTNIRLVESSAKSASSQLYKDFSDTCNSELSKLILGNTLTTESNNTGTQALGTVHQGVEEKIEATDKQLALNVLNYDLTDTFIALGIDTTGGEFSFVVPQNKDLSAQMVIDMNLKSMGLPLSDDYLYETYNRPKPDNYEELKKRQPSAVVQEPTPKEPIEDHIDDVEPSNKEDKNIFNTVKSFFVNAPTGKGALEW